MAEIIPLIIIVACALLAIMGAFWLIVGMVFRPKEITVALVGILIIAWIASEG